MLLLNPCEECDNMLQSGWVACPYCGAKKSNFMESSISLVDLVKQIEYSNNSNSCASKKYKSKCCNKYKKKNKHCKKCPNQIKSNVHTHASSSKHAIQVITQDQQAPHSL